MAINLANNNSLANITALPSSISGGAMTLLATQTASGSANLSFTSSIDDTYDSYVFKFYNIHPATDNVAFQFNLSVDTGSNYNVTKTTTVFRARHDEADSQADLLYVTGDDLAQSTGFQSILKGLGNDNDECGNGTLTLFNPSSTVFVKHFIASAPFSHKDPAARSLFTAGYGNTTSAVDAIKFEMSSGTFDGVIKLYGIS